MRSSSQKQIVSCAAALILTNGCATFASEMSCAPNKTLNLPFESLVKGIAATSWKDVQKFCSETAKAGVAKDFLFVDPVALETLISERKLNAESFRRIGGTLNSTWLAAQYPSELVRLLAYSDNLYLKEVGLNDRKKIRAFLSTPGADFANPRGTKSWAKMLGGSASSDTQKPSSSVTAGVCAYYGITQVLSCQKALGRMLDLMLPQNGYTLVPVIREVLENPKYVEGTRKAALKVLNAVESGSASTSNIFDDLKSSYRESGLSLKDSEECAWNLMGVISTGGANISGYLLPAPGGPGSNAIKASLAIITAGALVLDSRAAGSNHLYSYPKQVRTNCDQGKPYHFWMSAFLARKVASEQGNLRAASAAAWITETGYQMKSKTVGRDPSRAFKVDCYDVANNKIRMDLAYSAAGSNFGIQSISGDMPELDIDKSLKILLENATTLPKLSKEEADKQWEGLGIEGFRRWRKIFDPDRAFDFFSR